MKPMKRHSREAFAHIKLDRFLFCIWDPHNHIDSAASSIASFPVLPLRLFQLTGLRFMKAPTAPR